jgi:tetrahydromethanopterin S-methyltransferase subunit G
MDFKQLIDHYETLPKSELIEKLVLKNAKILSQDNQIEKQNDENKRLQEIEKNHQKINGELTEQIKKLKGEN